jgi:hypothetical protein
MLLKPLSASLARLYLANITVPGHFEPTRFGGLVAPATDDRPIGPEPRWALHFAADFFQPVGRCDGTGRFVPHADLPAGTRLVRFGHDGGGPELMGTYGDRRAGWRPARSAPAPDPVSWRLRPGSGEAGPNTCHLVRARYRGADYEADLGPGTGEVTLIPRAEDGSGFRVGLADLDALELSRLTTVWCGAEFEVVDSRSDGLTLVWQGGDRARAEGLGLVETDAGVWRATVGHDQVTQVAGDVVDLLG